MDIYDETNVLLLEYIEKVIEFVKLFHIVTLLNQ